MTKQEIADRVAHLARTGTMDPRDGGQMVQTRWHGLGGMGALAVTVDHSDGSRVYRLHRWRADMSEYAPIYESVTVRSRRITAAEVVSLLDEE